MFYFRTINKCENIEELNIKIREEFIKRYKNGTNVNMMLNFNTLLLYNLYSM